MQLYADEDFPYDDVVILRTSGHDVVTVQEDGLAATADEFVLARAFSLSRSVLTYYRGDFERLHRQGDDHCGILSATHDNIFPALAARIQKRLSKVVLGRWCIRVNRLP